MRQSTLGHVEWNQPKNLRILNSKKSKNQAEKCEFDKNEWNTLSQFLIDPILVCCIRSLRVRVNPLTSQSSLTLGLTKFDYRAKMSYSHYAAFSYTFEQNINHETFFNILNLRNTFESTIFLFDIFRIAR